VIFLKNSPRSRFKDSICSQKKFIFMCFHVNLAKSIKFYQKIKKSSHKRYSNFTNLLWSNNFCTFHLSTYWLYTHRGANYSSSKNIFHIHYNPYIPTNQFLCSPNSEIIKSYGISKNKSKLYSKNRVIAYFFLHTVCSHKYYFSQSFP
jgi:hypothetical protein